MRTEPNSHNAVLFEVPNDKPVLAGVNPGVEKQAKICVHLVVLAVFLRNRSFRPESGYGVGGTHWRKEFSYTSAKGQKDYKNKVFHNKYQNVNKSNNSSGILPY